jgi:transposase
MREEPHRLIFIDECGARTNMTRARGRAPRGERVRDHAPFRHAGNQTFVAGLRSDALVAPWVINGAMDGPAFETWVETQLAPTLRKGDVVIADNLKVHKSARAAAILREKGAWFLLLPRYSTDLNPIEMVFAKVKACLRRIGARTIDALVSAIGEIRGFFGPDACWNYFRAAGNVSD